MLTKEKLDSWYEPKKVTVGLTEKEEAVAEEVDKCDICHGTGEMITYSRDEGTGYNWIIDDTKPCICQLSEEEYNDQDK